jgi:hypothetical protein
MVHRSFSTSILRAEISQELMKIHIVSIFVLLAIPSLPVNAQQLDNLDVDISSGSTLSNASLPVRQLTGGPFTINNAGTIESTDGDTIRLDVSTAITNTGLIDAEASSNSQTIQFFENSGNNSLSNSGTIRI